MRDPKTLYDLLTEPLFDSRELIERLEELESDRTDLEDELETCLEAHDDAVKAGDTTAALVAGEEARRLPTTSPSGTTTTTTSWRCCAR